MTDKPSRNEEEYFAKQEADLLRKAREEVARASRADERKSHYMKCPKDGADLVTEDYQGVQIDRCPECRGMWLDAGETEILLKREGGGIISILRSVIRGVEAH